MPDNREKNWVAPNVEPFYCYDMHPLEVKILHGDS
jgi:hypothetical protein